MQQFYQKLAFLSALHSSHGFAWTHFLSDSHPAFTCRVFRYACACRKQNLFCVFMLPEKPANFSAYYSKHRIVNHCYLFTGCNRNLKHCHHRGMDGETKSMGSIWLTDSSVDRWLKAACPLLWLGFPNNMLHTLEKAITLTTSTTLEFPLLRKMYFHLKGFIHLRWILLSAFFSFEPCVYYFHSIAGLIKLKFQSHQPASWLPGSGGRECLAS